VAGNAGVVVAGEVEHDEAVVTTVWMSLGMAAALSLAPGAYSWIVALFEGVVIAILS